EHVEPCAQQSNNDQCTDTFIEPGAWDGSSLRALYQCRRNGFRIGARTQLRGRRDARLLPKTRVAVARTDQRKLASARRDDGIDRILAQPSGQGAHAVMNRRSSAW